MTPTPWPHVPPQYDRFREPPREYGILPFWFLNGALDPDEMRHQLAEFRDKGMPGIILHGRYGLETPYIGDTYLERIRFAVDEAKRLGLQTWVYDEMNWPSGTADGRVLKERPDLAQRYIECIAMPVRGPWFAYLTGADSRYLDFERSTPVAAFAASSEGELIDLTPNLSFQNVIPWEAPAGNWTMMYIVEKQADYYIDALDPESTREYLRIGYEPYEQVLDGRMSTAMLGFYTDEPAMHYYLSARDQAIVPWTKNMFRRFLERNGYDLRSRLPHLFFDISDESARVRHDFYDTLSDFYSDAYYRQIHEWCRSRDVLFTGHLLYEEWLRQMIRVEGNLFRHYRHMDVTGVDHLYPIIGSRDRPDEHVAMKVASSAAHQNRSPRLLCESFGGIFMDATMRRMKWVTDWEYVLGVNLLNPHGFHYTLEGPRKRDWPPSMFYQYPWWRHYGGFSRYVSRLSSLLSGGRHVAKLAVVWPINAMFATYTPQARTPANSRIEADFNALTDMLLRVHHDFDYVDEDDLATAAADGDGLALADERHELVVVPPMTHCRLSTIERLERFVADGGRVLGMVMAPRVAFGREGTVDVADRVAALFGRDDVFAPASEGLEVHVHDHDGGGRAAFIRTYAVSRQLPERLQRTLGRPGVPESGRFAVEPAGDEIRYVVTAEETGREDVTEEVQRERAEVARAVAAAIDALVRADVVISNPDVQYLHRVKDDQDVFFLINSTAREQGAQVGIEGAVRPELWDPSTGERAPLAPWRHEDGRTWFDVVLQPVGSAFVLPQRDEGWRIAAADVEVTGIEGRRVTGLAASASASIDVAGTGAGTLRADGAEPPAAITLDGEWEFESTANALVIDRWLAAPGPLDDPGAAIAPDADTRGWHDVTGGAWSYQLPAEPETPYPIDVWYRVPFAVRDVPAALDLIVDGFAGESWEVHVDGERATAAPRRSDFDAQMQALDIRDLVRAGDNVLAIRIRVTEPTGGLLDKVKLTGPFSVVRDGDRLAIAAPRTRLQPASWHEQDHPFLSGEGVYRRTVTVDETFASAHVVLEADAGEDVVEAVVNGERAGVRLWGPYRFTLAGLLRAGENTVELRVCNTPENMLSGTPIASGLRAAPRLVAMREVSFEVPA